MTQLYLRNAEVQVGDDTEIVTVPNSFKITYDIQHMLSANSNIGNIKIYNLAENTKEIIKEKGKRVRLYTGYAGGLSLLHDGQILESTEVDENADRITQLILGGQAVKTNLATFNKSYVGGTKVRDIVADALPTFNLPFNKKILNFIPESAVIPNFSFSGKTKDAINSLLQPLSLQWFERNSEILFSKKGDVTADQRGDIQVLNSNTGLIKTAPRTDRGVNAVSLLNPQLEVGKIVKIESDVTQNTAYNTYNVQKPALNSVGFYKIIQINYTGGNWDGKNQALLWCVPYDVNSGRVVS